MRSVTITLHALDLAVGMAAMRPWLDEQHYETLRFTCDDHGDVVKLRIDFRADAEGEAFSRRFGAEQHSPIASRSSWTEWGPYE
jgi:hypothetical protein